MDDNNNFTLSEDINGPLLAAAIGIEMLAGLITNSFVIIMTVCCLKTLKEPSTIFLTNMLLSNLIIAIFVMPFPIITCSIGEWVFGSTPEQKVEVCEFVACLLFYSFMVATEGLVLVSCDRFFFIVKDLQYKKYMTANKAVIIVAVSWILAAILTAPPLVGFGAVKFVSSIGTCFPGWKGQTAYAIYVFIILMVIISSVLVTSIWTFVYTWRYLQSRSHRKSLITTHGQRSSKYLSQEKKLIGLFGMLILAHLLCLSPAIIINVIGLFTIIPDVPYAITLVLFLLLTLLSPLVQSYFRRDIRNIIMCQCGRRNGPQATSLSETISSHINTGRDTGVV